MASNLMDEAISYIKSHDVSHKYLQLTILVVDRLVLFVRTIILVEVFALALSHYSQNPQSVSNVFYSFASLPLDLIQYNYDLGDCDCLTITPLSLFPDIHTCCPGSNGSKVAICSMMYIKNFLTVGFPHCPSQTTLYSDMEGCD